MPPKRKNTKKQASNGKPKQPKQEGQKAVSHEINVPIDEGFKDGKRWAIPYINSQDHVPNWIACVSSKVP